MKASPLNSPPQSGRGLGGEAFQIAFYLIHFKPLLYELPTLSIMCPKKVENKRSNTEARINSQIA